MPLLPSGKIITLIPQTRLLNAITFAPKPGHFWINSPIEEQEFFSMPGLEDEDGTTSQVPLPESIEDFKKFITVVVAGEIGEPETIKFNLSNFPPDGFLSRPDKAAWLNWLESQPVQLYLEMRMQESLDQVEYFKHLKSLEIETKPDINGHSGGFDLFLEKEPLELKKQRHSRILKKAEEYLARLKAMPVKDPQVQVTWADLLMEAFTILKTWRDGEDFFRSQYMAYPEQVEFHFAVLKCMLEQSKEKEVEAALWEAVGQFPQKTDYWNFLIQLYLNQQSYGKALEITNMALAIIPGNKDLLEDKFVCETAINRME